MAKENFYKIGISGYSIHGDVKRYKQYKSLGYQIKELKIIEFSNEIELRENFEKVFDKIYEEEINYLGERN